MINSQYSTFPQGSLFIFNYGLEDTKNSLSVWSVQKQLYFLHMYCWIFSRKKICLVFFPQWDVCAPTNTVRTLVLELLDE